MIRSVKSLLVFGLLAGLTVLMSSCFDEENLGPVSTDTRILDVFNEIEQASLGDVHLHISNEFKIVITTHENLFDDITTDISGNKLVIKLDGKHKDIKDLDFDVYAPVYQLIKLSGVGNITGDELIAGELLEIDQSGVGNIVISDVDVENIVLELDDVGNLEVNGVATNIVATHSGVGNMKLFDLTGTNGEVSLTGSGNIEINVSDHLILNHSGVGNIYYMGNPAMEVNHTGVGKIQKVN